ncbi:phenylacetate--CoA ligase family protein [Amycolatopsis japonica]|uniref:phenylacetate--CoA ligase family protein n=1 Tax=Amycolatopsis japonica TaxID=208439 RepID=UPI00366D5F01
MFKTGGTTSAPKMTVYTRDELRDMAVLQGNGFAEAGLRPGDRVANLFYAGSLYASFLFNVLCLQESRIPSVHIPIAGSAPPEEMATMIVEQRATVLLGTPTTVNLVAANLVERGISLPDVHLFLFGGEAFYEDQRGLLSAAFPNAAVMSLGYASVDAGVIAAPIEGVADHRVHRVHTGQKLAEIVDDVTGETIRAEGRPGRLIFTDLVRRLMPVIRYPVGDRAAWVDHERRELRLLGRADEGARVGPVTVYLEDLRSLVEKVAVGRQVAGIQVVQRRHDSKDQLVLRIAGQVEGPDRLTAAITSDFHALRPMFAEHVDANLIAPLVVEYVRPGELVVNPRSGKVVRLIDERFDGGAT